MISDKFIYKNTLEYFITSTRLMKQIDNKSLYFTAFYDVRNGLGALERQEKELSIFYEDIEEPSERVTDPPKVFTSEQLFNGYSEETLTFAIIVTAFVALLLGIFLGVFVTRFCASPSSQKTVQRESTSSEDINRYSVTTLSR